jgi:NDP-sugar pyrophosphorylase family protein
MKAMLLAAGEGRRLRPLTEHLPKPMLPVLGRPLISYLLDLLRQHGVREVAINLHHCPAPLVSYVREGQQFGLRIVYSHEERLLGSAGAVRRLASFWGNEPFFVVYGDVLTNLNLSALLRFHRRRDAAVTVALYRPEALHECGVARLDEDSRVIEFVEKPPADSTPSPWASAGVYVVDPAVLDHVPDETPFDFGYDLLPRLLNAGAPVYGYRSEALVLDIGVPQRYRRADQEARRLIVHSAA